MKTHPESLMKTTIGPNETDPLLAKIATYEFDQSRIPLAQFTMFVQDSLTNPALLKQIEARLDQFLQSDATAAGKDFAFRELSLIGTDASLPVLTPLLTDPAKAEMARYALSKIPGPAADEALKALKNVAGPAQVPGLVDILVNASTAADRGDASQTLALVLKRSQPPQIGAVLAAYRKNTAAPARLSLMEVMGQTSSEQALPVLRDALKDPTAEIRRGAILALTDWADAAPMPVLLDFAKTTANQSLQVLALLGNYPCKETLDIAQVAGVNPKTETA
jgi:HEAT repeat protein